MRRIAAVFSSSKRDNSVSSHSSAQNTARRSFTNLSLSRKRNVKPSVNTADLSSSVDSTPSTPQLSAGQSSASSTGSHDEATLPSPRRVKGKSWTAWLGPKSGTIKRIEQATPETGWSLPPAQGRPHVADGLPLGIETGSETSESDEEEEQEEQEEAVYSHNIPHARQVLQDLTQIGLQHQRCSSPFVQQQAFSVYPRSCNSCRILRKQGTMEVLLHKRRMLERLRDHSITEQVSIQLFEPLVDEVAPHKTDKVLGFSPGLRQWITRPPFEDRLCIWLPTDETFTCRAISSAYAVAAIEFSESIEITADLPSTSPPLSPSSARSAASTEPPRSTDVTLPTTSSSSGHSGSYPKPAPQIMVSSPLRNDAAPPHPVLPRSEDVGVAATSPASPTTKRGVRFAEDKEDNIPIGHVMRIKKQKEEKARFLREERERRQFEEERRKQEQEKIRRDQERAEWEKERKAWEKEKRAMEDERKARLYAEEFNAARQRAEDQRGGIRVSSTSASLRDRAGNVQESRRYSRLPYDAPPSPRNHASEPASPSPHTSSPSSSRPPSVAGGNKPQTSGHSRPSSFYSNNTNSSEDIGTTGRPRDRSWPSPGRTGSTSSLFVPPVPSLPVIFPADMPLLPPNAPFMMNSYSQPRSNQSRSPSSSSSRHSIQRNSSTESMNKESHSRSGSSPRTSFVSHSQTQSSSSTRRPDHQRRTSDGSDNIRQSNNSSHPHIRSSNSQQSLLRGRSQHPAYNVPMVPNPWTAMPSRTGAIPTVMPFSSNSVPRAPYTRRQTALS